MSSHVISALIAKRAEIAGLINDLERKIRQHRTDLAHIDRTIGLFDPTNKKLYMMKLVCIWLDRKRTKFDTCVNEIIHECF